MSIRIDDLLDRTAGEPFGLAARVTYAAEELRLAVERAGTGGATPTLILETADHWTIDPPEMPRKDRLDRAAVAMSLQRWSETELR